MHKSIFLLFLNFFQLQIISPFKNLNSFLVSTMDVILEEIYDLPGTYTLLNIVTISLVIHISTVPKMKKLLK